MSCSIRDTSPRDVSIMTLVASDVNSDPQDFKGKKGRQGEARKSCKGQLFTHCSIIHWSQKTTLCRRYVKRCATVLEDIIFVVEFPEKFDSFRFLVSRVAFNLYLTNRILICRVPRLANETRWSVLMFPSNNCVIACRKGTNFIDFHKTQQN